MMGYFITNLSIIVPVKEFLKSVKFGEVTGKMVDCVICPFALRLLSSKMQNSLDKLNNFFITDRNCY